MSAMNNRPETDYSLRRRLMAAMSAGFLGLIMIISALLWNYARNAANNTFDLLLAGASLSILERTVGSREGPIVDIPYSALEIVGLAADDRVFYRIYTPSGETITGERELPGPEDYVPSTAPVFFDATYSGEQFRFARQARSITSPRGTGWVIVQIGHTQIARNALQLSTFLNGVAGLAIVSLIGLVFVWLAISQALRPLASVETNLRLRHSTDLTPLKTSPPREIASLIASINGFIQRLKSNQQNTENFIADVAHQIRTSLSALHGQLDIAVRQTDPQTQHNLLVRAEEQTKRTIRLTNQLLAHAMIIHRADHQLRQTINLVSLMKTVLEETLRDTAMRAVDLAFNADDLAPDDDVILGDPVALREAVKNLIDNAVKHGPSPNRIEIRIFAEGENTISLSVEDAGEGIPEAQRQKAQERFTSLGRLSTGSGLGLAIVKAVAESHAARFWLSQSSLGGLKAQIDFPQAKEQ